MNGDFGLVSFVCGRGLHLPRVSVSPCRILSFLHLSRLCSVFHSLANKCKSKTMMMMSDRGFPQNSSSLCQQNTSQKPPPNIVHTALAMLLAFSWISVQKSAAANVMSVVILLGSWWCERESESGSQACCLRVCLQTLENIGHLLHFSWKPTAFTSTTTIFDDHTGCWVLIPLIMMMQRKNEKKTCSAIFLEPLLIFYEVL